MNLENILRGGVAAALIAGCGSDSVTNSPATPDEPFVVEGYTDEDGRAVFVDSRNGLETKIRVVDHSKEDEPVFGALVEKYEGDHPDLGFYHRYDVVDSLGRYDYGFLGLPGTNTIGGGNSPRLNVMGDDMVFGLSDDPWIVKSFTGALLDYLENWFRREAMEAVCSREEGDKTIYYRGTFDGNEIVGGNVFRDGFDLATTVFFWNTVAGAVPAGWEHAVSIASNVNSGVSFADVFEDDDFFSKVPVFGHLYSDTLTGLVWDVNTEERKRWLGLGKVVDDVYHVTQPPVVGDWSVNVDSGVEVSWNADDPSVYSDDSRDLTRECVGFDLVSKVTLVDVGGGANHGEVYEQETLGNNVVFDVPHSSYLVSLEVEDEIGNDTFVDLGEVSYEGCEMEISHYKGPTKHMGQWDPPESGAFAVRYDVSSCVDPKLKEVVFVVPGTRFPAPNGVASYEVFLGYERGANIDLTSLGTGSYRTPQTFSGLITHPIEPPVDVGRDFFAVVKGLNDIFWLGTADEGDTNSYNVVFDYGDTKLYGPFSTAFFKINVLVDCCE